MQMLIALLFSVHLAQAAPVPKTTDTQAEVMISRSETQAITALQSLIKQNPNNPDLWLRLAELYNRKSKTSRFFELSRETAEKAASLSLVGELDKNTKADLKMSLEIYEKILKNFPKFESTDTVLFHAAFTSFQLGDLKRANQFHGEILARFPSSPHVPDSLLALGEMTYEAQKFKEAEGYFSKMAPFSNSRVYAYGLYKLAWAQYNQKKNDEAIQSLVAVVKLFADPESEVTRSQKHNLRPEALRDLSLFYGETHSAKEAYGFFSKLCTENELADSLLQLGKLYLAHNRENEMKVFLGDLLDGKPTPQTSVRGYLLLAEANEHLKNIADVNASLARVSEICQKQKLNECEENFTRYVHELSHKWWEQWIKTKKDQKLAENTQTILELSIQAESKTNPDLTAHSLLADLIFQRGEFHKASLAYEWISNQSKDPAVKEDTFYSAIATEQKLSSADSKDRLLTLTDTFLKTFPHAKETESVQFARGFTQYISKDDVNAEKTLSPLAADAKDATIKTKSQDLVLDILNRNQRFADLKKTSASYSKSAGDDGRAHNLEKVAAEADFSDVQKKNETAHTAREKFTSLVDYSKANPANVDLSNQALYQAIALAYASGLDVDGAIASLDYAKKNHDDKAQKALADASLTFLENGYFEESLTSIEQLMKLSTGEEHAKWQHLRTDVYFLLGRNKEALAATFESMEHAKPSEQSAILGQMYAKFKLSPVSDEFKSVMKKIKDQSIEPYFSELTIKENRALFEQKKWTQAFNLAKQIMGRKTSDLNRAKARIIQAQILQKEFFDQSLHTTLAKLNLVLGLKMEKLEKAQEAFLSAQKISPEVEIRAASLAGLRDSYVNFIESLKSLRLKNDLPDNEQKALATAIGDIITPMNAKLADLEHQIAALPRTDASSSELIAATKMDYENLSPDAVWSPLVGVASFPDETTFIFPQGFGSRNQAVPLLQSKKWNDV